MNKYNEIRSDYYNQEEQKIYIDAWRTSDDNEEGIVIAKVDVITKDIEYLDDEAKEDANVKEAINNALSTIDDMIYNAIDSDDNIEYESDSKYRDIIIALSRIVTEFDARENSNNSVFSEYHNTSWDDLCEEGIRLFNNLRDRS